MPSSPLPPPLPPLSRLPAMPSSPRPPPDPALSRLPALLSAAAAGLLFAAGLAVSGMTQPAKVIGFLNLGGIASGQWDPSLAFVMGGALLVTLIGFAITPPNPAHPERHPWFAQRFQLPTRQDIDTRLLLGAALFGIGWGAGGLLPRAGPEHAVQRWAGHRGLCGRHAGWHGRGPTLAALKPPRGMGMGASRQG